MKTVTADHPRLIVRNLQRKVAVNATALQKFGERALGHCRQIRKSNPTNVTTLGEISVLIVSNRRMAGLHQRFMGESGPTDVLTFQHGEIVISAEMARSNARFFRNPMLRELQLYIAHGLLHLHGFNDGSPAEAREMEQAQRRILRTCCV